MTKTIQTSTYDKSTEAALVVAAARMLHTDAWVEKQVAQHGKVKKEVMQKLIDCMEVDKSEASCLPIIRHLAPLLTKNANALADAAKAQKKSFDDMRNLINSIK